MASLPGFRFDITGASGSQGLLGPKSSWRAYILPRGGYASQDSTGTVITFDTASVASRFTANDWIQAGLSTANIRQVSAVGGNSISVSGSNVTVTENDRIFLIGTTQPTVSGGSATYTTPNTLIYQRDDDSADLYSNSMITSSSTGLIQGFAGVNFYDVIIQDSNQANQGSVIDLGVGAVEGVSTSTASTFGVTVTVNANMGVTGTLTVDSFYSSTYPCYNVKHPAYGALGDGSTDDSTAINAAITAASSGGNICFPPGTYIIGASSIYLGASHSLVGAGPGLSSIKTAASSNVNVQFYGGDNTIRDITIDGNHDNNTTSTLHALLCTTACNNVNIHNTSIINSSNDAIHLNQTGTSSTNWNIDSCTIENSGWRGMYLPYLWDSKIVGNRIFKSGSHGIIVLSGTTDTTDISRHVLIDKNIVDRSQSPSNVVTGNAEGGFLICYAAAQDVLISNNWCRGNTSIGQNDGIGNGDAVGGQLSYRVNICNNTIIEAGQFGIDGTVDSNIVNNIVLRPSTDGIVIGDDATPSDMGTVLIADNTILDPNETSVDGAAGIAVTLSGTETADSITFYNNQIYDRRSEGRTSLGIAFAYTSSGQVGNIVVNGNVYGCTSAAFSDAIGCRLNLNGPTANTIQNVIMTGNNFSQVSGATNTAGIRIQGSSQNNVVNYRFGMNSHPASSPWSGSATMVGGSVSITNTHWPSISGIRFTAQGISAIGTPGALFTHYDGTSKMTITSSNSADTSIVYWRLHGNDD